MTGADYIASGPGSTAIGFADVARVPTGSPDTGPRSLLETVDVWIVMKPRRLFRVTTSRDDDRFEDAFRSHYERRRPPRGPEGRAAVIHMALSMFDSADVAAQLAARVPKLGGHVTAVDLMPDVGLCVAKTGGRAHWSVWGRPPQLLCCVTDVLKARD